MIEPVERGNRAVILHPVFSGTGPDVLDEFRELARSANVEVASILTAPREHPDARYYAGQGKIDELADAVQANDANLILVSRPLSAVQERNIENRCQCRVLDRTSLILDIFARRARSHEGKLQVELAQLHHLSTRLVRGWTHLERQKGGIGLRGPGETQLETDRRLIGLRIRYLRARLVKVNRQREQSRRRRRRSQALTVALVGYTNAGKSTLFNALTDAGVDTRDVQFVTLDPTVRQLPEISGEVLLADTVGFVSELPPELIAAFRATLLETREADLLLHVIDASDQFHNERLDEVDVVLESIGAGRIPVIRVYNKIDRTGQPVNVISDLSGKPGQVSVSALTGAGLAELLSAIEMHLAGQRIRCRITLDGKHARLRAKLFELGVVSEENVAENGCWDLFVDIPVSMAQRLARQGGMEGRLVQEQILGLVEHDTAA